MRHRNRDKASNNNHREEMELNCSTTSDFPCKKHPSSSSVGICAHCLKDRLVNLVCSDCGEQRLSSCSCSEISSNRNSCTVEVGSVGRVSFLIENETGQDSRTKKNDDERDDGVSTLLRRSNSASAEVKKKGSGFWKLARVFGRKKEKEKEAGSGGFDAFDDDRNVAVSRSRSLCSFRNGFFGSEDGGRSSISGARSSGVTACVLLDSGRRSGFSEAEPRKSDIETFHSGVSEFANRRVFSLRESDFGGFDDSGFIDLRLDFSSESKMSFVSDSGASECGVEYGIGNSGFGSGFSRNGSCRITVNDRGVKRGRKSLKGWRWIFKNQ